MFRVVLVRHGEAKSKEEDPERGLTEKGGIEARRVAEFAATSGLDVSRIFHSGKSRAAETAAIFAEALGMDGTAEAAEGLAPNDDPRIWAEKIETLAEAGGPGVMLVGHLPHMGILASLLACGGGDEKVLVFEPATACCMEKGEDGCWKVKWRASPGGLGGA